MDITRVKVLGFVNFDLGGFLLQNGIPGFIIEAENKMTTVGYGIGQA